MAIYPQVEWAKFDRSTRKVNSFYNPATFFDNLQEPKLFTYGNLWQPIVKIWQLQDFFPQNIPD
jgi:hypothetical protein